MSEIKAGQVWKRNFFKDKFVVVTEVIPHYVGITLISYDVRYKALESLDETSSTVIESSYFKKKFELVSG